MIAKFQFLKFQNLQLTLSISLKPGGNIEDYACMVLINTVKIRFLWATNQYVHENIRIMKLFHRLPGS